MKLIKTALIAATIGLVAQSATAATTQIRFAKGSYCGSFSGNVKGRTFTLGLGARQTLTVDAYAADVIVRDPKGRVIQWNGQDFGEWTTRSAGRHTITLQLNSFYPSNQTVTFCAY